MDLKFVQELEKLYLEKKAGECERLQRQAWERFCRVAASTHQSYRYIHLKDLYKTKISLPSSFSAALPPMEKGIRAVFINGRYSVDDSTLPEDFVILPLSKAFKKFSLFLNARLQENIKLEQDPFALLNAALFQEGIFIYIPSGVQCSQLLEIVHIVDNHTESMLVSPRVHLYAGKDSYLEMHVREEGSNGSSLKNSVMDFVLEEGAQVSCNALFKDSHKQWQMESIRATLKKSSRMKFLSVTNGAKCLKQDFTINLAGEKAETEVLGLSFCDEKRESHVGVWIDHQAPHTRSQQKFKNVVSGSARASFLGKILVQRKAQKTEAYQMSRSLLLSEKAIARSRPYLEIFADDVKASHGSTCGQLNKEHLFYLKTRGMPHELAKKLLVYAFSKEILDSIHIPLLRKEANLLAHHVT